MRKFSVSIHKLSILATIAMVVLILPLVLTSFYNRPVCDDLVQPYAPAVAYRETGSVFRTISAAIKETYRIWNDRSGIFSSMFVSVFAPYVFNYKLGYIHPIFLTVFMVWAIYRFVKCLHLVNKNIPSSYVWLITMILSIMLLTTMPSLFEGYYWYSGAVNYTLFFILSLLLFACLITSVYSGTKSRIREVLSLTLYCIGFFFLGGANWMTPTYSIVIYAFISIWLLIEKRPKRYLLPFLFLLIGYALAIAAPGNVNRQAEVGVKSYLINAFFSSFQYAITFCLEDRVKYILPLLLLPIFFHLSRFIPKIPHYLLFTPILSICILASAYFPLFYASYPVLSRHLNVIFFLFSILFVINEAIFVFWIAKHISHLVPNKDTFSIPCVIALVFAISFSILSKHSTSISFSPLDCYSNYMPLKATVHLVQGYSKNYADSYDHLVYKLQTTDDQVVLSDPTLRSPLLGTPDLQLDPANWINQGFVSFYTNKDILLTQPRK